MVIHEKPIQFYVDKLKNNEYFSLPGYGDAEWMCMLKEKSRIGTRSGFGMLLAEETGDILIETLRVKDPNYLPATPMAIKQIFGDGRGNRFMSEMGIEQEFYERDMILDDLAANAGLYPLISQLQEMNVILVGNQAFSKLDIFPQYNHIGIGTPDFHLDYEGMELVVENILRMDIPAVYLFAAGMSSAIMISRLHGKLTNSFLLDVGSIFDAFVGIGGQREWRSKLYEDPEQLKQWKIKNLTKTG